MRILKYNILLALLMVSQFASATAIDFYGTNITINGNIEQLAVQGSDMVDKVTFTKLLDNSSAMKSVDHVIDGKTLKVSITNNDRILITIPRHLNVTINPVPIIYEGSYIYGRDANYVHVYDTSGEVEISGDGYNVYLARTSGSLSVVTHENINAVLPNLAYSSIVSLDTYRGNIVVRVPYTLTPNVKATAPNGTVDFKDPLPTSDNTDDKGSKIILHTELGKQTFVSNLLHLPKGPTHPELRDQLIKMWIEDQGKNRMDNASRKELTGMGYGPFIESLDDVYKGHFYSQKHQKEFDAIVAKYGFPNEEMVGFQYALGAVRQVIFQSDRTYFEKYKNDVIRVFGKESLKMYDRMHRK